MLFCKKNIFSSYRKPPLNKLLTLIYFAFDIPLAKFLRVV